MADAHGAAPNAGAEDSTFLTGVRTGAAAGRTAAAAVPEPEEMGRVRELHRELLGLVGTLNSRIGDVLSAQEGEFLRAYRAHSYGVQKEIAALRERADEVAASIARSDRIRALEAERDWYRTEATNLATSSEALKSEAEVLRARVAALSEENAWNEQRAREGVRTEKRLALQLEETRKMLDRTAAAAATGTAAGTGGGATLHVHGATTTGSIAGRTTPASPARPSVAVAMQRFTAPGGTGRAAAAPSPRTGGAAASQRASGSRGGSVERLSSDPASDTDGAAAAAGGGAESVEAATLRDEVAFLREQLAQKSTALVEAQAMIRKLQGQAAKSAATASSPARTAGQPLPAVSVVVPGAGSTSGTLGSAGHGAPSPLGIKVSHLKRNGPLPPI